MVYPNESVQTLLNGGFVTAKVHMEESVDLARRFSVTWTPTLLFMDGSGTVHYRIVPASLPVDEFILAVKVGLGKVFFSEGKFDRALEVFEEVVEKHGRSLAAPPALYWLGVSFYKKGDKSKLVEFWKRLSQDHPSTHWAKAVSFLK